MHIRKTILSVLLACMSFSLQAAQTVITSPDGNLAVTVFDEQGTLCYAVAYKGQRVLNTSSLGLNTDIGDFTRGLSFKGVQRSKIDTTYHMTRTKVSTVHYTASQADITYQRSDGQPLVVTFCVSNHDVAFRYTLQPKGDQRLTAVVYSEASSFNLPANTTTFLTPQSLPMVGWQRTKPSYEEEYKADAPMTDRSAFGEGFTFPCLFHTPDNFWVLVSETGVDGNYCASHLSDYKAGMGYQIVFPNVSEMQGMGSPWAAMPLPSATPWRTITIGSTLNPIVETTIPYDVVQPRYEASQDYRPGRYTWSWLVWQDQSINYDDQVRMIDLSAKMGFEYVLVDAWWDKQIGRDRIAELNRYANQKGVKLLLWYNSNGFANDAPQTPKHCMNTALARNREMAWLKQLGIAGIKVDFFGGDKQETLKLYEDILADANRYGLQVVFHGCTLPRGWERMYPNFVASEAALASENVYFSEHHAQQEGFELCMHPFARNAVAAFDWGGIMMNRFMSRDNKSRHPTDVFEMATGIVLQTSINCVAMYPNNLQELPQFELDFLRQLPTTWDEVRFLDGYPTKYVVLARRTGSRWYVAGLNGQQQSRTLQLSLPMFAGQTVKCYIDQPGKKGAPSTPVLKSLKVDKKGLVKVTLQPMGGLVITQ